MKQASITIYLVLILMILISLFATCIEGARIQATKLKIQYASDAAALSCFADYRKELFDKYDLLFVDISYGGCCTDYSIMKDRLGTVFAENCIPEKNLPIFFRETVLGIDELDVVIDGIQLATDHEGEIFKSAASSYIKSKYGIAELELLANEVKVYEQEGFFSNEIESKRIENEKEIEETAVVPKEGTADEEVKWEKIEVDNPADEVNDTRKGVLNLVIENTEGISTNGVDLSTYASKRENNLGTLAVENENENEFDLEKVYFSEYVLEKCGNYLLPGESDYLTYECEYIIAGGESDTENLRKVVNKILLIRETSNVAHIMEDQTKMEELEVLFAGLAAVTTIPELQPIIKYSLVLAWGYAESISDLKRILKGEKVAFYKTNEQWRLSLENMLAMEVDTEGEEDVNGIGYQDYLRMFVYLKKENTKIFRMMDIVEMAIRSMGYDSFRLDTCMNRADFTFVVLDKHGKTYEEKKKQKY